MARGAARSAGRPPWTPSTSCAPNSRGGGVVTALARVKSEVADDLRRAGVLDRIGTEHLYATLPTAVEAYRRWRAARDDASGA